jgi:hypothetical protein
LTDSFLKGEVHFVRGIILAHKSNFLTARDEMQSAAEHYQDSEQNEKYCLSLFNGIIFSSNAQAITVQEELIELTLLISETENLNVPKVRGLCLRQKSYIYFQTERFLAAREEIEKALQLIEAHCPSSDYQLALIHAADCAFSNQELEKATLFLNYLPQEVDSRVDFANAYVRAKISAEALMLDQFSEVPGHWLARYEKHIQSNALTPTDQRPIWHWNVKTSLLTNDKKSLVGKMKLQSLEGQLLQLLEKKPASKELLCEILWPEYSNNQTLDERFFRLKSRLRQKLGDVVQFDGHLYSLKCRLQIR